MLNDWTRIDAYVRQWIDYAATKLRPSARPNLPPTLLTDGDGVLLDFTGRLLERVRDRFPGSEMTRADLNTWRTEEAIGRYHGLPEKDAKKLVYAWLEQESFWVDMDLLHYAQHICGVPMDKVVVTSPWVSCDTWHAHRTKDLRQKLGFDRVVVTDQKHYVFGDVFIEDKWANLERWLQVWPEGRGVYVLAPYSEPLPAAFASRVWTMTTETAGEVMEEVQKHLQTIARAHPVRP